MKLTAYENSKRVGETEWGVATYDYEPRSAVHVAPSSAVTCRSPARNQEAPAAAFVDVLYRVEGDTVHITGKRVEPVKLRSGTRSLLGLVFNAQSHNYRARFVCDCGRKDHMSLDHWRKALADSGCRECRRLSRAKKLNTIPADPIKDRIRRDQLRLMNNPITAEKVARR